MVTSSMPEEGKSVTAANLAVVFAQANYRTVVVDADLRHPALHEVFEVNNEVGLGNMLGSTDIKIEDCIQDTSVNNLKILTSGMPLLDPSERLGSERMKQILDELKSVAEVVIVDSPPVLVYADAIVLSGRLDGVIMVIQAGKSTRAAITQTLFDLQNANANLLGSIFNQSPKSDTFSVNKAYMQGRPQLSSPMALVKKQKADIGPFQDLRDSAVPLNEKLELPGLVREEATIDETPSVSMDDVVEIEPKDEVAELNSLDSTMDKASAVSMDETLEQENKDEIAELESLDSDVEVNENVEATEAAHEETGMAAGDITIPEHQEKDAEQGSLVSKAEPKEKVSGFQQSTEGQDKKSRKRRARKSKSNGSKDEAAAVDQINIPSSDETNSRIEMDQISDPIDHDIVLVDRNKDE